MFKLEGNLFRTNVIKVHAKKLKSMKAKYMTIIYSSNTISEDQEMLFLQTQLPLLSSLTSLTAVKISTKMESNRAKKSGND